MDQDIAGSKTKRSPTIWATTIAGLLAGWYAGVNLLIPLTGAGVTFYLLKKLAAPQKAIWFGSISVQVGHALWFIFGLAYLGQLSANLLDPAILLLGVLWLYLRPGLAPVVALSIVQIAALAYNSYVFAGTAFGTNAHQALFVHIIFRALAVGLMSFALVKSRKELAVQAAAP